MYFGSRWIMDSLEMMYPDLDWRQGKDEWVVNLVSGGGCWSLVPPRRPRTYGRIRAATHVVLSDPSADE
jgi:hypothetical protein